MAVIRCITKRGVEEFIPDGLLLRIATRRLPGFFSGYLRYSRKDVVGVSFDGVGYANVVSGTERYEVVCDYMGNRGSVLCLRRIIKEGEYSVVGCMTNISGHVLEKRVPVYFLRWLGLTREELFEWLVSFVDKAGDRVQVDLVLWDEWSVE